MLTQIVDFVRSVWRGAWQPLYPLNPQRRWWHYVEYVSYRVGDVVSALFIFLFPPAIALFVYEHFAANPKGVVASAAFLCALWIGLIALAYFKGRTRGPR